MTLDEAIKHCKEKAERGGQNMNNDLISREYLRDAFDNLCCHNCKTCRNFRKEGCSFYRCDLIDNAPTVERPKTDILEQIIAEINSSNRGTCDYYIVDRIEEIINEYQKGGAEND